MPRYLQTQSLLKSKKLNSEYNWIPTILNLDAVETAIPVLYEGFFAAKCTEVSLLSGAEVTINIIYSDFMQYFDFVPTKPPQTPPLSNSQTLTDFLV